MTLRIISAQEVLYDGEVTSVTLPGAKGSFTVLRNHASLVSTLTAGNICYVAPDGTTAEHAVSGGLADVDHKVISVCVY